MFLWSALQKLTFSSLKDWLNDFSISVQSYHTFFKPSEPMLLFSSQRRWKGGEIVEVKEGDVWERIKIEFLFNFFASVLKKVDR